MKKVSFSLLVSLFLTTLLYSDTAYSSSSYSNYRHSLYTTSPSYDEMDYEIDIDFEIDDFEDTNEPIIMGYYANFDIYKTRVTDAYDKFQFNSSSMRAKINLLNTLVYAFFETDKNGRIISTDAWADFTTQDIPFCYKNPNICFANNPRISLKDGLGNFHNFANATTKNRLIAIGGFNYEQEVRYAMKHPYNFVDSLKKIKEFFSITGIDIDYEPKKGISKKDADGLYSLVKTIKEEMGEKFMITFTFTVNHHHIENFESDNWQNLDKYVDYFNIMGYDVFGNFPGVDKTALHSPLYSEEESGSLSYSDDAAVNALFNAGISKSKMVLGIPTYGRAVANVRKKGINQEFNFGGYIGEIDDPECNIKRGTDNQCSGSISYNTILKKFNINEVSLNKKANGAYSNFEDKKHKNKTIFISYDSQKSTQEKVKYIIDNKMAGTLVWTIAYDAEANNSKSILNTINKSYGITPKVLKSLPKPPHFEIEIYNENRDTNLSLPYVTATIIINEGYHPFGGGISNKPIASSKKQIWGTKIAAKKNKNVLNYALLDTLFSNNNKMFIASKIMINSYENRDGSGKLVQKVCKDSKDYLFKLKNSYKITLNPKSGTCKISKKRKKL